MQLPGREARFAEALVHCGPMSTSKSGTAALALTMSLLSSSCGGNAGRTSQQETSHQASLVQKDSASAKGSPSAIKPIRELQDFGSKWGGTWFYYGGDVASPKTQPYFVTSERAVLCLTREEAEREECENKGVGGPSRKGHVVRVVGDAPFDGHWRATWDSEGPDGVVSVWVRADRIGKHPDEKPFADFGEEEQVSAATLANGLSAEKIAKLPKGTLLLWKDIPAPAHLNSGRFFASDPLFGTIAYLPTKGGKPVAIKLFEDVNATPREGEGMLHYEHSCLVYGGCSRSSYLCEKGQEGFCDKVSILATTLGPVRTGPPMEEGPTKRIAKTYPKKWHRYFMPALEGVLLADRNGLHRFPLVGEDGLPQRRSAVSVQYLDFDVKTLPAQYKKKDSIVHGEHYRDGYGESWLVVSNSKVQSVEDDPSFFSHRITIEHMRITLGGQFEMMRTVRARLDDCMLPGTLYFDPKSVEVMDRDVDGVAEVQVGYGSRCVPKLAKNNAVKYSYKLMLLEKGEKYIIRSSFEQHGKKHKVVLKPVVDDGLKLSPHFERELSRAFGVLSRKAAKNRWSEFFSGVGRAR